MTYTTVAAIRICPNENINVNVNELPPNIFDKNELTTLITVLFPV